MLKHIETSEILQSLIAGHRMTPQELDDLLQEKVSEDLYLDYKHGHLCKDKKQFASTIRVYLSGFANSAGGTLIVGVDGDKWNVTGCSTPGGGDLAEWASRCLVPIASHFSPLPRFQVVKHNKGDVLVAFTDRSYQLVPIVEKGKLVYYLRLHDQTLRTPEYLVSDIMLGRRQYPYLSITEANVEVKAHERAKDRTRILVLGLRCTVENNSLSWAEDVRLGFIAWIERNPPQTISNHLLSYVEVQEPNKDFDKEGIYNLSHSALPSYGDPIGLDPFSTVTLGPLTSNGIPIKVVHDLYRYKWKVAVYLISKEAPPIWHQLDLMVNQELLNVAYSNGEISSSSELLNIKQLSGKRPIVAWEGFGVLPWNTPV